MNHRLSEWPAKIFDRVERALDAGRIRSFEESASVPHANDVSLFARRGTKGDSRVQLDHGFFAAALIRLSRAAASVGKGVFTLRISLRNARA